MQANDFGAQVSLRWLETWKIALLGPSKAAISRIAQDPKATVTRGILWSAIVSLVVWLFGLQRGLVYGWVATYFGLESASRFLLAAAPLAVILAVGSLLVAAATSHALARALGGNGAYRQLVYTWGVLPVPFVAISLLVILVQALVPVPRPPPFSPAFVAVQLGTLFILATLNLYLTYVGVVAYAAVERLGTGRAFGLLILEALLAGAFLACLSSGTQQLLPRFF